MLALGLALSLALAATTGANAANPPTTRAAANEDAAAPPALDQQRDGRVTVDVLVDGSGPFPFILDTGANRTAIGRVLAESLRLPLGAPQQVHGLTGAELRPTVAVGEVRSGSLHLGAGSFPVIEQATLGAAAGLLAANELLSQGLALDFGADRFRIVKSRRRGLSGGLTTVRGALRFGTLLSVPCQLDQIAATCIIDTGSVYSFVTQKLAADLLANGQARVLARDVPAEGVTASAMTGDVIRIDRLRLGSSEVLDNVALAADAHVFKVWGLENTATVLLGVNVLRAYGRVRIDYPTATISLGRESCKRASRLCQTR